MKDQKLAGSAAMIARGWISKQVMVRKATDKRLRRCAKATNRSVAAYIRHAIEEQLIVTEVLLHRSRSEAKCG